MDRTITATEANRSFSELLKGVRHGTSYTVTSHGKPVARLMPVDDGADVIDRRQKFSELLAFVETLPIRTVGPWAREDLYD